MGCNEFVKKRIFFPIVCCATSMQNGNCKWYKICWTLLAFAIVCLNKIHNFVWSKKIWMIRLDSITKENNRVRIETASPKQALDPSLKTSDWKMPTHNYYWKTFHSFNFNHWAPISFASPYFFLFFLCVFVKYSLDSYQNSDALRYSPIIICLYFCTTMVNR